LLSFRDIEGTPTYEVTVSPSDDETYTTSFQIVPPGETPDEPSRDITNPDTGGWNLTDTEREIQISEEQMIPIICGF